MHIIQLTVRSYELDSLGHVNHAVYLNWLEHARMRMLDDIGLPLDELFRRQWLPNIVHIELDYRSEARAGQALRIESEMEAFGRSSVTVGQRIVAEADDRLVAEAKIVAVFVGPDGKPIPVPQPLRVQPS
ncbi:MAG: thioesterase family protein [Gemmatimonadota bacterium]|jgi:thioesterase III